MNQPKREIYECSKKQVNEVKLSTLAFCVCSYSACDRQRGRYWQKEMEMEEKKKKQNANDKQYKQQ